MKIKVFIAWTLASMLVATGIACSCATKPPPKEALQKAAIVFSGRVVMGRVVKRRLDNKPEEREMREFLFEVDNIWKGPVPKRVFVLTRMGGGDCGYDFEIGHTYLVYAYGDDTQFGTNICTRTCHEDAAGDDIKQLGAPTKPQ
jgi:hypothetical protein